VVERIEKVNIMHDEAGRGTRIPLIDGVDVQEGLGRVSGNVKVYKNLLRSFVDENASFSQSFMSALESNEGAAAGTLAHTLKGVAGNLGARELFRLSKRLESELKKEPSDKELVDACFKETVSELNRVMDAVERALGAFGDVAPIIRTSADAEQISILVSRLESSLRKYETASSDLLEELEETAGTSFGDGILKRIRALIDSFEYDSALAELKKLPL